MSRYRHVFLSPHLDDAVLSCGATIHRWTRAGEPVLVVTVFAAAPATGALSPLAESFHARWGLSGEAVATRRAENDAALAVLGAEGATLDFLDCIYRGGPGAWHYGPPAAIFGEVAPGDEKLSEQIAGSLRALLAAQSEARVHAPLAVGNHVDHQIVHAAALRLRAEGWPVDFYEDYPYAQAIAARQPRSLERTVARAGAGWTFQLESCSEENLAAKVRGIAAYVSQLEMLFGSAAAIAPRVRNYARRVGAGRLAERFWRRH